MAVGQMGIPPDTFNAMTPVEFIYAWSGWIELQENNIRQAWELERWAVWVNVSIQLDKKERIPMTEMFPLPWDEPGRKPPEMTMDERRERIRQLIEL